MMREHRIIHVAYLREASACCSFNSKGNVRASNRRTSNRFKTLRFFYCVKLSLSNVYNIITQ